MTDDTPPTIEQLWTQAGIHPNPEQRVRQAMLGCAPAHELFDLIQVNKRDGVEAPRSFNDYKVAVDKDRCPSGVELVEIA